MVVIRRVIVVVSPFVIIAAGLRSTRAAILLGVRIESWVIGMNLRNVIAGRSDLGCKIILIS